MHKKITVYTQAYNAEKYLRQCLDSVVNQTYPIHQYILVNDNSSDNTQVIMEEYASKYDFIELQSYDSNKLARYTDIIPQYATGEYVAIIDADDWWEPDYLERLVSFSDKNNLDLAITGTVRFEEETKTSFPGRKLEKSVVLTQKQFAHNYDTYWKFPSTVWGSIFKLEFYKKIDFKKVLSEIVRYGLDTVIMLQYIKQCDKIGIDNTALYHYRKHKASESFTYYSERFTDNVAYYNYLKEFLKANNELTDKKIEFLNGVHLASLKFTIEVLSKSQLNKNEQIDELKKIINHFLTKDVLKSNPPNTGEFKLFITEILKGYINELSGSEYEESLLSVLNGVFADFDGLFDFKTLSLLSREANFGKVLIVGDKKLFQGLVAELIAKSDISSCDKKIYAKLFLKLIPGNTLVSDVKNEEFFALYISVVKLVLTSQNSMALDRMTEIMLSGEEVNCAEDFLNVYIKLAALENHVEAFIFGNIQKAYLFIDEKRYNEARRIVNDLVEMGLDENDENIVELKKMLNDE